jgi:hypothetical protein
MAAKRFLIGVGLVAVGVVAYVALKGLPPAEPGGEATIAQANRSHDPQIVDTDVVLKDPEVQDLIQSEVFQRLVEDEDFRNLVASGGFSAVADASLESRKIVLADGAPEFFSNAKVELWLRKASRDDWARNDVGSFVTNAKTVAVLGNRESRLALRTLADLSRRHPVVGVMLKDDAAVTALRKTTVDNLRQDIEKLRADPSYQLKHPVFQPYSKLMADSKFNSKHMLQLVKSDASLNLIKQPQFIQAIANPKVSEMLLSDAAGDVFQLRDQTEFMMRHKVVFANVANVQWGLRTDFMSLRHDVKRWDGYARQNPEFSSRTFTRVLARNDVQAKIGSADWQQMRAGTSVGLE